MPEHDCQQEEVIKNIQTQIASFSGDIRALCSSNREVVATVKEMTKSLNDFMLDNKENGVKIITLEKEHDILFARVRRMEDEIVPALVRETDSNSSKIQASWEDNKEVKLSLAKMDEGYGRDIKNLTAWKNRMTGATIILNIIFIALIGWLFSLI